jgi:Fe-S cluster assembly iron-binding protein IscA
MLTITETAATKVKELLAEEAATTSRFGSPSRRAAVRLRYAMYLDDQSTDKDAIEEQHGVRIVIDKMSVPYLSAATVDFVDSSSRRASRSTTRPPRAAAPAATRSTSAAPSRCTSSNGSPPSGSQFRVHLSVSHDAADLEHDRLGVQDSDPPCLSMQMSVGTSTRISMPASAPGASVNGSKGA